MKPETTQSSSRLSRERVNDVYRTHAAALQRFLLGVLKNEAAAADALQATMGKLIEKGHTARKENIKSWLFQVAYNEALMLLRKEKSNQKLAQQSVWTVREKDERSQLTGLEHSIRQETVDRVQEAIGQLSSEQQVVLRKRIYEGIKFAEIAKQLDLPLGTVLSRMHSATRQLKQILTMGF